MLGWIQRGGGGRGGLDPLKNHKNIEFISDSGPDPLKNQYSMFGHHQHASKTPFKWRFAGGSMMVRL